MAYIVETRYYTISSEISSLLMYGKLKLKCTENIQNSTHIEKYELKHLS